MVTRQETMLMVAGGLHFALLIAASLVPGQLRWKCELAGLQRMTRQLIWVHGFYVTLMIVGIGLLSLVFHAELTSGSTLGRALSGFIALFWCIRLGLGLFVFDTGPHLTRPWLIIGERMLTVLFAYFTTVYTWAAIAPEGSVR